MKLKGKIINFLGDSITEGYSTTNIEYRYDNVIKNKSGIAKANNYGISGTTIAYQKAMFDDPSFNMSFCSRMYRMDTEADVIVVFGGSNDYGHGDAPFGTMEDETPKTFCGAVDFLMANIISLYPNSTTVFLTPARREGDLEISVNPQKADDARPLKDYAEVIKAKGRKYSIAVLDMYEKLGIDPNNQKDKEEYTTDGLHFNNKGNEKIADAIIKFLSELEEPSPKTEELIMRNIESAQHIYAAKKNFLMRNGVLSESDSKILIGHISDIHGDLKRYKNAIKYLNYFDVDFSVHTGDVITWDMRDSYKFFEDGSHLLNAPIYNCIGNHETFKGQEKPSNEVLHKWLFPNSFSFSETINSPNGRGYYYADCEDKKIRLIVVNDYDFDEENTGSLREAYTIGQTQCDWLIKTLKEAAELEYGVIIASHESDIPIPPGSNDYGFCQRCEPYPWGLPKTHEHIIADIVDAFKHAKELKLNLKWEKTGVEVLIDDKFDKKGEFICYLNGHRHGDYVGYLPGFSDQLSIGMPCSGCFPEGYHNIGEETSDLPRIPDTVTEDCVNFYTIDREQKTITIVRIGACVNDEMKVRRSVKLKYEGEK